MKRKKPGYGVQPGKPNKRLFVHSSANIPFLFPSAERFKTGSRGKGYAYQITIQEKMKQERKKEEGIQMRKVIVKKRKLEKEFNNVKLVFTVFDVCEISKNEDGSTEISISQIYNVTDIWDFEDVNELFK